MRWVEDVRDVPHVRELQRWRCALCACEVARWQHQAWQLGSGDGLSGTRATPGPGRLGARPRAQIWTAFASAATTGIASQSPPSALAPSAACVPARPRVRYARASAAPAPATPRCSLSPWHVADLEPAAEQQRDTGHGAMFLQRSCALVGLATLRGAWNCSARTLPTATAVPSMATRWRCFSGGQTAASTLTLPARLVPPRCARLGCGTAPRRLGLGRSARALLRPPAHTPARA